MQRGFSFVCLLLLFTARVLTAIAQAPAGSRTGTMVDASNAAVAGATVEITDNATNKTRTVESNNQGTFTVPQLEFGSDTVKVTAAGFKTNTATELKIDVGKEYSLAVVLEP